MRGRAIGPATTDSARIAVPIPPGDRHAGRGLGVAGRPRFANWLLTLLFLFATAPYASAAGPPVDWSKVAHRVIPAVVNISVAKIGRGGGAAGIGTRERFSGSGFIIDPQGDIVTNKHVIKGAFRIEVMLHDGTELRAHVVAAAAMVDLAVIRIDAGKPLPYLTMASTDTVRVGDPVLAVGNPLGIGTSVSSGIVSALNRNLRNSPFDDYVQTDAAINHGNSGGPLLNTAGQVIGVNTILLTNQKNEGSNGLGFAISSVVVNYVVQHLENPAQAPVGWIGTHVQDVTSDLARAFAMPRHAGCVITKVDPDSPARRAGLRSGDVILAYGGKPLANARQLMREVATTPIGRAKRLRIWRRGMARSVRVTVRAWPNLMEPHGAMLPGNNIKRPVRSPNLGMLMAPLTPLARKQVRPTGCARCSGRRRGPAVGGVCPGRGPGRCDRAGAGRSGLRPRPGHAPGASDGEPGRYRGVAGAVAARATLDRVAYRKPGLTSYGARRKSARTRDRAGTHGRRAIRHDAVAPLGARVQLPQPR